MRVSLFFFFVFLVLNLSAQPNIPIGQWQSHLAYSPGIMVVEAGQKIYAGTRYGLFSYNQQDNTIDGYSKEDGFSEVNIRRVAYQDKNKVLCIAYQNSNVDFIFDNQIINERELLDELVSGEKQINSIDFHEDLCFFSTSFGMILYDLKEREWRTGFFLGRAAFSASAIQGDSLYSAAPEGIRVVNFNINPENPANWHYISNEPALDVIGFGGRIWASFADSTLRYWDGSTWQTYYTSSNTPVFSLEVCHGKLVVAASSIFAISPDYSNQVLLNQTANYAMLDQYNQLWLTTNLFPCVRIRFTGGENEPALIRPAGPPSAEAYSVSSANGEMWVASGGMRLGRFTVYTNLGIYQYDRHNQWQQFSSENTEGWPVGMDAIVQVLVDPRTGHKWLASLTHGLVEFHEGKILNVYRAENSPLIPVDNNPGDVTAVSGMAFDAQNRLWMSNWKAASPLAMMTPQRQFSNYPAEIISLPTQVIVDTFGQVWQIVPALGGINVFDPATNKSRKLETGQNKGNLPTNGVNAIVQDKKGQVWVGTSEGLAVFYNPGGIFGQSNFDAQPVRVYEGDELNELLEGEEITALAVDGANRKWIGTNGGVWLVSPDGDRVIAHFTADLEPVTGEYGPLISNAIRSIAVNGSTGEVFFVTENGIQSYRSTATEGAPVHDQVYTFPNPVRPGYNGPIAIQGLVTDAIVKITDITGKLVYETKADGGQAIWYGKNFRGEAAASGVYLVMSVDAAGEERAVTKILIVR